jgi:hypothetical protein
VTDASPACYPGLPLFPLLQDARFVLSPSHRTVTTSPSIDAFSSTMPAVVQPSPISPLRPKHRSAPPSTRAGDAIHTAATYSTSSSTQAPKQIHASTSHAQLRPAAVKSSRAPLTVHTGDCPSPTSSPGGSPPGGRPRPLPRVPNSASSESAINFRPLPRTPATASAIVTSFAHPVVLSPEQLPPRKDSLRPLLKPLLSLPEEDVSSPQPTSHFPAGRKHGASSKATLNLDCLTSQHPTEIEPPSPADTVLSALVFNAYNPDSSDEDDDTEDEDSLPRTRPFRISTAPRSQGVKKIPRESRHWYREANGKREEQCYEQVLQSLRELR